MARIVIVHGQTRASPAANHYLDGMQTYHHVRNRVCGRDRVYDDDPVDEGIRWLRGSRCWEGGEVWEGATKLWDRYIGIPTAGDMGIL